MSSTDAGLEDRCYRNDSLKEGIPLALRVLWTISFLVCFFSAVFFMLTAWQKFSMSPIVTTVEDTYYPLTKIPFPAVTVCPSNNVKRREGEMFLMRYLNVNTIDDDLKQTMWHLMRTFSFMQYPFYFYMESDLNQVKNISQFDGLNMTDFMLEVLPTYEDVFHKCVWQGREINCTQIFEIQRSESGFCYSFNSLTSENTRECSGMRNSILETGKKIKNYTCVLFHNAASGTTTGLEVYFNPTKEEDSLGKAYKEATGIRVMVHGSDEYPQLGNGLFMLDRKMKVGVIKILPSVTESSSSLRSMTPDERNCYFFDERSLEIYPTYAQDSCFIECRLQYIAHVCKCQPYFFSNPTDDIPECTPSQLKCILEHNRNLRVFLTPVGSRVVNPTPTNTSAPVMNCSDCLPLCSNTNYDIDAYFSEDTKQNEFHDIGYLNVFYKEPNAVKYLRAPAIDMMQLLVSFGGIAGLFLGISLLTCVEVFYHFLRWCKSMYYHYYKERRFKKPQIIKNNTLLHIHVNTFSNANKIFPKYETEKFHWPIH